jgi:hypothetical protein
MSQPGPAIFPAVPKTLTFEKAAKRTISHLKASLTRAEMSAPRGARCYSLRCKPQDTDGKPPLHLSPNGAKSSSIP